MGSGRLRIAIAALVCGALAVPASAETLQDVYQLAKQNDALLKSQQANAEAGRETANIYKSALLPQLSADAGYSKSRTDLHGTCVANPATLSCDNVDTTNTRGSVTLQQNIVNLESWYDYQRGKKLADQADAQWVADQQNLVVRVTEAYIKVLNAIDNYQTARAEEDAIARQLEQTKQRFNVGLIAITDVQESQASFDSAHANTLDAQGQIGIAFEALQVLTGQPVNAVSQLAADMPVRMPEPSAQAEWEKIALENSPALKVSALAVDAARKNTEARKAGHLPTVTGTYQYNDTESDINYPPSLDNNQRGNTVALNLHVPLYSGGGTSARKRQAYDQQMIAEETHNNNVRNTVQQVRSLHLAVNTDVQRVSAQKQAIVSAQSALDATQAGYEVGTRNIVDVLNAQQMLYKAKLAYANARYRFVLDTLRLQQAAGTLGEDNLQKLNAFLAAGNSYRREQFQ